MEEALIRYGLPVKCRKCKKKGVVKPATDYNGWYKSKLFRKSNRWFCPEHYNVGKQADDNFYVRISQPVVIEENDESDLEKFYKLIDEE